jgi:hypothetical protein
MNKSARESWEYQDLIDWKRAAGNPVSQIEYNGNPERKCLRSDTGSMDLWGAINEITPAKMGERDSHVLRLGDRS